MHTYLCIIGRSPEIAIEELVTVAEHVGHIVEIVPSGVVMEGTLEPVSFLSRLGGTVKIAEVVKVLPTWREVSQDLWLHLLRHDIHTATGKYTFGYSAYGVGADARRSLYAMGLSLKKHLRHAGVRARLVSSKEDALSSVVVKKNHLIGRELVVLQGSRCYVGKTVAVQDFDSYGFRDYGRPSRNMERGLLPPKLAQIMLNLADVTARSRVLDPFCGGGTILQEALLMGFVHVWGSDKDRAAIDETTANIEWLSKQFKVPKPDVRIADALELATAYPDVRFDAIVTEPYLGPAKLLHHKRLVRSDILRIVDGINGLYNHFFRSAAAVAEPHARAVIIFPIIQALGTEYTVGDLSHMESYGWKLQNPEVTHRIKAPRLSPRGQLLYARDDQVVAREVTVWERAA